ncbi:hypothetical protein M9H77_08700 [Catharanthus roseus]|uniref:Uncharacterized protein n=1 Tax=Catharanthus roseus TaxID=4058 RepID=A0ACC0BYK7_CATRO|nr:hypothetical protein M9H77_08700 [Catharanthus roseus]
MSKKVEEEGMVSVELGCLSLIWGYLPDLTGDVDDCGWTALHYASRFNHQEMAGELLIADHSMGYAKAIRNCSPIEEDGHEMALRVADFLRSKFEKVGAIRLYRNSTTSIDTSSRASQSQGNEILNRVVETYQVVVVLTVTISFAAGFTIPGGYKGNDDPAKGLPSLVKIAAFIAFSTADITATISSLVALLYLLGLHECNTDKTLSLKLSRFFIKAGNIICNKLISYGTKLVN